ncbi:MAG: M23 family metallopeptidase [Candidatus Heimdallarchaeota archaeon]|nr:M23 family metallopeptidase [Candidatus Heimdallarchaeota archaeon]
MRKLILLLLILALFQGPKSYSGESQSIIWPLQTDPTGNFPLSSTFGPRLKASENYRYDYHRGIDIPTPVGTPVVAIADGLVRLSGNYSYYADTVIQVQHQHMDPHIQYFYANYLHLSEVIVEEGDSVAQGDILGYSGTTGFDHLHFEIREGGIYQQNCTHPLEYLPYSNIFGPKIERSQVVSKSLLLNVSVTSSELDLIGVSFSGMINNRELDVSLNFDQINHKTENITILDYPLLSIEPRIIISPSPMNALSNMASYVFNLTFSEVIYEYQVAVEAVDVKGLRSSLSMEFITPVDTSAFPDFYVCIIILSYAIFKRIKGSYGGY